MSLNIRRVRPGEAGLVLALIRELAEYENAPHEVVSTPDLLRQALFGPDPAVFALMAVDDTTGHVVGFALWFRNFSTWLGRHGVYLEDLYVRPSHRGHGYGKALLEALARTRIRSRAIDVPITTSERLLRALAPAEGPGDSVTVTRIVGPEPVLSMKQQ